MFQVIAAVKALIENDGKYLAVVQKIGDLLVYDLPGGGVRFDESPYEALKREVKEEASLEIKITKPLGMWWFFRKTDESQVVCSVFLCKITGGKVDLAHNPSGLERITKAEWLTVKEMLEKFPDESLKDILKSL